MYSYNLVKYCLFETKQQKNGKGLLKQKTV